MPLMTARPWKHPKSGVYWLRKRVPDELRALIGKREEKSSLQTRDPAEAKRRHAEALAAIETRWANLRQGPKTLTERQAHEIASAEYQNWIDRHRENPSEQKFWDVTIGCKLWGPANVKSPVKTPTADFIGGTSVSGRTYVRTAASSSYEIDPDSWQIRTLEDWCLGLADQLLEARGLVVDDASRQKMAEAVAAAVQRACVALEHYAKGEYDAESNPAATASDRPGTARSANVKGAKFDELLSGWVAEKLPNKKTAYAWRRVWDQLSAFVGHSDAERLSADDLVRWKASLLDAGLKSKTIRDGKLAPVRAILQWAVDNRRLRQNPAERITIDLKTKLSDRKRGYSEEEASKLLASALAESDPVRRWVPWLCAYSGARVSEVCQLRREDVLQHDGIWCLRFAAEAGSLKNANSERVVPLHPILLEQGFLDFVEKTAVGPIFAELTPDRFGNRGGNGTKLLGRWIRSLGLTDPRIAPNHSWRRRFKTLGRRYDLAPDIVNALTGHGRKTVADAYGDFPIQALSRELRKLPEIQVQG
jgi:integrase